MLVDINLLPQKEKKNQLQLFSLIFMTLLTILLLGLGTYMYLDTESKLNAITIDLTEQRSIIEDLEQQWLGDEEKQKARRLQAIINNLQDRLIPSHTVVNNVIELLPNNASIIGFQMADQQVDLSIITQNNEQPIFYFHNLKELDWVSDVTLHTISLQDDGHYSTTYTIHLQTEKGDESNE